MVTVLTIKEALITYNIVIAVLFWTYKSESLKHIKRCINCFVAIKLLNAFELFTSLVDGMTGLGDVGHIGIIFLFNYSVQIWVDFKSPFRNEHGALFAFSIAAVYAYRFIEPIPFYSTIATSVLSVIWILLTFASFVVENRKVDKTEEKEEKNDSGVVVVERTRPTLSEVFFISIYTILFLILGSIDNITYVKANDSKPIDLFSLGLDTIGYTVIPLFIIEFSHRAFEGASKSGIFDMYDIDSHQLNMIGGEEIVVSERKRDKEMTNFERIVLDKDELAVQ